MRERERERQRDREGERENLSFFFMTSNPAIHAAASQKSPCQPASPDQGTLRSRSGEWGLFFAPQSISVHTELTVKTWFPGPCFPKIPPAALALKRVYVTIWFFFRLKMEPG